MLKEMIDGKEVVCSPEKEKLIRDFWDLNEKYPEYQGHCAFDWVSPAFHDMSECARHHKILTNQAVQRAMGEINKKIAIAEEEGNDENKQSLLAQRKSLRVHFDKDFSGCKTVEELRSSIPEELKPHWNK